MPNANRELWNKNHLLAYPTPGLIEKAAATIARTLAELEQNAYQNDCQLLTSHERATGHERQLEKQLDDQKIDAQKYADAYTALLRENETLTAKYAALKDRLTGILDAQNEDALKD